MVSLVTHKPIAFEGSAIGLAMAERDRLQKELKDAESTVAYRIEQLKKLRGCTVTGLVAMTRVSDGATGVPVPNGNYRFTEFASGAAALHTEGETYLIASGVWDVAESQYRLMKY